MKLWGQPTKGRRNGSSVAVKPGNPQFLHDEGIVTDRNSEVTSELDSLFAEETAQRTRELFITQGWCLWKCSALGGEVIAVVREENVEGVPDGYPVYTEAELEELCQDDVSETTLCLVHEAKKLAGAKVV